LTPSRVFIREGTVQKISTKGAMLQRTLILFNDLILFTKKKGNKQHLKFMTNIYLTWINTLPDIES
jgi:hypothetical protein